MAPLANSSFSSYFSSPDADLKIHKADDITRPDQSLVTTKTHMHCLSVLTDCWAVYWHIQPTTLSSYQSSLALRYELQFTVTDSRSVQSPSCHATQIVKIFVTQWNWKATKLDTCHSWSMIILETHAGRSCEGGIQETSHSLVIEMRIHIEARSSFIAS